MIAAKSRAFSWQGESAPVHRPAQRAISNPVLRRLLVAVLVLCTLLLPEPTTAEEMSRFQRLLGSLERAAPSSRSRFARIALLEMAEVHIAEAGLARNQSMESAESDRLRGWARAVEAYADQLLQLHDQVEQGAQVALLPELLAHASILVGERSTIVSHPRGDQQQALEQAILQAFCEQENCLQLLAAEAGVASERIPESPPGRPPSWSFSRSGPVCEQRGLQIEFPAAGEGAGSLAQSRKLCQQLFAELQLLVAGLRRQQRQGVVPDWNTLTVSATPHQPEHHIRLNTTGDSLLLAVPLLYSTSGLLPRILPWLRSLAETGDAPSLVLQARELGWAG